MFLPQESNHLAKGVGRPELRECSRMFQKFLAGVVVQTAQRAPELASRKTESVGVQTKLPGKASFGTP